jgi:hypothetical protein
MHTGTSISIDVIAAVQFALAAVIIPGAVWLFKSIGDIKDHLAKINGRVSVMEAKREGDQRLAEEIHQRQEAQRKVCQEGMREELRGIWEMFRDAEK